MERGGGGCWPSYLQPGGEREWKVERENISALSAIFFHRGLSKQRLQGRSERSPFTDGGVMGTVEELFSHRGAENSWMGKQRSGAPCCVDGEVMMEARNMMH
ncbi:hypothetical protein AOLI_G00095400 [Acnodon oligacanthus]